MTRSEQIQELAAALAQAQGEFEVVAKDSLNPFFKSKYAALPDVVKSASPILAARGLSVTQLMDEDDTLTTILLHSSGQFIGATARLHLIKDDPQAQGSATTYLRRYAYMSILGLVADVDDDGNAASKRTETTERRVVAANTVKRSAPTPEPVNDANASLMADLAELSDIERAALRDEWKSAKLGKPDVLNAGDIAKARNLIATVVGSGAMADQTDRHWAGDAE